MNAAYLEKFQGGNYGIPVYFGKRLLGGSGLAVSEANVESKELLACYENDKEKNITSCNTRKKES
ncbi:MAG: hypothetical protein NTZ24_13255 [Deltaproteobacteria bacterium]|nr:hypothetical protein [Deltaproteobacteria bacterium]